MKLFGMSMKNLTDTEYELIVNESFKLLYSIAYNYTRDSLASEDIVQETFIKFYLRRNTFKSKEHIKNWLIRVVINSSINVLKHNKKVVLVNEKQIDNSLDTSFVNEKCEDIYNSICLLKDNYRKVIVLYYYENYSIKEIANILKISEKNVTVRLTRARQKLKQIIDERRKSND